MQLNLSLEMVNDHAFYNGPGTLKCSQREILKSYGVK